MGKMKTGTMSPPHKKTTLRERHREREREREWWWWRGEGVR